MKFNVAAEAARLGVDSVAVDRQEYEEFVRHHIECERLGTKLADAAKHLYALVDRDAAAGDSWDIGCLQNHGLLWRALDEAVKAFDGHQWPEEWDES